MVPSLYDRLAHGRPLTADDEDESICKHILRMLTTRQGSVQTLPDDYGLPDLNDASLAKSEILYQSSRAIEACINRYEPRLQAAKVRPVAGEGNAFILQFSISAMKTSENGRAVPWRWVVSVDGEKVSGKEG